MRESEAAREKEMTAEVRPWGNLQPLAEARARHILDAADEADKFFNSPSRKYVRDAKAMVATSANVKEYPNSYVAAALRRRLPENPARRPRKRRRVLLRVRTRNQPHVEDLLTQYLSVGGGGGGGGV
ncbi:17.9 kDa class II heat shock protein-like [Malania oleifera]|uniref:17.9 kDa class II heat shock protein-like n=1 Tax=Malania oleifera TaxID=397392 RepID=UPI0025AE4003|nr:17.9 kDa class II heat shock protein-like [Malania oleifera]